jgi:hypothetical protein
MNEFKVVLKDIEPEIRVNGQGKGRSVNLYSDLHTTLGLLSPPLFNRARSCISFFIITHINSYHVEFHSCHDRWIDFGQCTEPIAQYYHFHSTHFFNLSTCYNQLVRWIMYVHFPFSASTTLVYPSADKQHHTGCTFTRTIGLILPIGCKLLI